jgi:diguanylate cyclase (GGDEF)-like protein/PAS domain S-box-containing protein
MAMLLALMIAFGLYVDSERRIDRAHAQRYESFRLAEQLRQSSDNLTRMARRYVMTGDPKYRAYYQEILDVRDGRKPWPKGYFLGYWEYRLAEPAEQQRDGEPAIAMLDLMRRAGVSDDELGRLAESKRKSDELTAVELEAMKLSESAGSQGRGGRSAALHLLHDDQYHQAKVAIMKPIEEFYRLMDARTAGQVRAAEDAAANFRIVFMLAFLGACLLLWRMHLALRSILGGSADEVSAHMSRIGGGDFFSPISVGEGMEGSVLAGLAAMQVRLRSYEAGRQSADVSIRASLERLNEAQHIARIGSWSLDPRTRELTWSDEVFNLFEIDPARFGANYDAFLNAIHPDDRAAVSRAYADSLVNQAPYEITHRLRMSDGRIKWVLEKCVSEFDAAGKALRSQGTVQDVTESKLAELALRQSEHKFSMAFDSCPVAASIAMVDDGRFVEVNANFQRDFGWARTELIGRTSVEVGLWPDRETRERWVSLMGAGGRLVDYETTWLHRNGERRSISLSGEITELDGRACILAYATDITARRLAQLALETSRNFNEQIFLASPIGIMTYDAAGQCLTANRNAVDQIGGTHEQLLAQNFRRIEAWKTSGLLASAEAALATGEVIRTEARFLTSFGKEVWQEAVFTRFVADGQPNLLLMLTDMSERRRQEEKTRQLQVEHEAMLSNAVVGITYLRQRHIVSCNRRFEEIFQYGPGELIGESSERLYDSRETFEHIGVVAYEAVAANRSFRTEVKLRHKDGSVFWGELSGRAIDPDHPHDGSIWIYADISDLKLVEADLRIAAAAFDSQEAIMVTDAGSVILKVNKAFTETTGYAAEDVVGRTPRLLQSGRHNADFYREMWQTLKREGIWQGEIWDRRKDGDEYPKWLTISVVKDDAGNVTHYVGSHFDITERKLAEEKIHQLAFFDQLTGLPNRTLLLDRLRQAMAASGRSDSHGALLFIDLDNFKALNDSLGHDVGDLLLKQVAQRLLKCVREGDTVARLGGDEFVVVLANLSPIGEEAATGTELVAEKILTTLNQVYRFGDAAHHSSSSIGVTLFKGPSISIDDLMKQADLTMYKAKEAGRNTIRFFDPAMELAVKERTVLESDLRRSVEANRFLLHYQAQVTGDGRVTGAEVLLRWQHPERGMVSPADFIPLAEETGLILPLGNWVLDTACSQLARWARRPETAHLALAVNVSAHQFRQADFVEQVLAVIADTGVDPTRLKLELTESMLVHDVQEIIEKMSALRAHGVRFSLDDFGTGYSSLSYLKRLPLNQLKIDQSFVRDVLIDPNDAAIAKTIVALAQSLGLGVIAEGVETAAQRDFLANSGCHAYQGYFFSRPLPLEGFEQFLRQA